jgi:hypothetical protein
MRTSRRLAILALLSFSGFGCESRLSRCIGRNPLPGEQDEQWSFGCQIPGFGGFVSSGPERSTGVHQVVYLTDVSQEARAREVLAPYLGGLSLEVRQARYTFAQLQTWKARARVLRNIRGWVSYGIDLNSNRIVVGISDPAAIPRIQELLSKSGLPKEAVIFERAEPIDERAEPIEFL